MAVSNDGSTLYIGGIFDTVNGQPRQNFAAVDTSTGGAQPERHGSRPEGDVLVVQRRAWSTSAGASRRSTGSTGSTWRRSRRRRRVERRVGALGRGGDRSVPEPVPVGTNCGPISNGGTGAVHSLAFAPDGNSIFVGGNFYYVNGVPRNALARVSATDGSLVDWRVPWATIPSESTSNPYRGPNVVWAIMPTAAALHRLGPHTERVRGVQRTPRHDSDRRVLDADGHGAPHTCGHTGHPATPSRWRSRPDGTRLFVGGHFGTGGPRLPDHCCGTTCGSTVSSA